MFKIKRAVFQLWINPVAAIRQATTTNNPIFFTVSFILIVPFTKDLTDTLSAVDIVTIAVKELGGRGGGGRVDMAQGGAQSAKNVDKAISAVKLMLEG